MPSTTTTLIDGELLSQAAQQAKVPALAGDLATDSRGILCLLFRSRGDHDQFFTALRALHPNAATTLKASSFDGQATGKQTILKPQYAPFAEARCLLIYCPSATLKPRDDGDVILFDDRGGMYTGPVHLFDGWLVSNVVDVDPPKPPTQADVRALFVDASPAVRDRARQAIAGACRRFEQRDPDACNNVYADLWEGYGIEFAASPDPSVRERGVQILPGLHDDRPGFLERHPALKLAYTALEASTGEFMQSWGPELEDLPEDSSLLEALVTYIEGGDHDEADTTDLLVVFDCAEAMLA